MGRKASETTQNSNDTFDSRTVNEHTVQWWFKKFCKGDKSLEDEEPSGGPWEVDNNQLRGSLKLILLKLHKRLSKNSVTTIGKIRLNKRVPHELTENQKIIVLKYCLCLVYIVTTNYFLIDCGMQ